MGRRAPLLLALWITSCGYEWKVLDQDDDQDGYTVEAGDCWDEVEGPDGADGADIHPEAADVPYDNIDQNCDGVMNNDADGDGADALEFDGTDCDDSNAEVNPGAPEDCADGIDNNCDGLTDEEQTTGPALLFIDGDEDGYGSELTDDRSIGEGCVPTAGYALEQGDCDDGDDTIHPGADEVCDGIDQDCDEETDEDATDEDTWYADSDGDGFGDLNNPKMACDQPTGTVTDTTDCDDDDAAVHPGADEVCNSIDDDCDDKVDDEDSDILYGEGDLWYPDTDVDGYGDPDGPTISSCAQPVEGMVKDSTDCDDRSDGTHPGATELCNGLDDDCDGEDDNGCPTPPPGGSGW